MIIAEILPLISTIMRYVLWGTIALGCIFLLIGLIMIIKRLRYNKQMIHNKVEINKARRKSQDPNSR